MPPLPTICDTDQTEGSNYKIRGSPLPSRGGRVDEGHAVEGQAGGKVSVGTSHLNMKISDRPSSFHEPMKAMTGDKADGAATESGPRSHADKTYSDSLSEDDEDDFWYEETLDRDSNKDHSHGSGAFKGAGKHHDRSSTKSLLRKLRK